MCLVTAFVFLAHFERMLNYWYYNYQSTLCSTKPSPPTYTENRWILPPLSFSHISLEIILQQKMGVTKTFAMAVIEFFFQLWREQIELLLSSWNFILVFFISSDIWFVPWKFKIFMKIWIIISTHHQYSFFKTLLFQLFFLSHYGWSFFRTAAVSSSNFMGAASYGASYTISHTVYMRWEGPYIVHT